MLQPPRSRHFPASATPSSPAKGASPAAPIRASTAAPARRTCPPEWSGTAPAWRRRLAWCRSIFLTAYQVHSPDVVTSSGHGRRRTRAARRGDRDAGCRALPSASPPPIAARCCSRMASAGVIGAAHAGWRGAFTGVLEATVAAMEQLGADRARIDGGARADHPPENYEVGPEFVERFRERTRRTTRFFRPSRQARPRHVRSARLHRRAADQRRHQPHRGCRPAALMPIRRGSSATAARRIRRSRITGGTSMRSHSSG